MRISFVDNEKSIEKPFDHHHKKIINQIEIVEYIFYKQLEKSGIARRINSLKSGTVKAISPCDGL